jgi:hypothetical protein
MPNWLYMSPETIKFDFSNNSRYTITIRNDRLTLPQ